MVMMYVEWLNAYVLIAEFVITMTEVFSVCLFVNRKLNMIYKDINLKLNEIFLI